MPPRIAKVAGFDARPPFKPMNKYTVQQRYASSYGGPWKKGEVINLTIEQAEAVNRDAPGTLKKKAAKKAKPEGGSS